MSDTIGDFVSALVHGVGETLVGHHERRLAIQQPYIARLLAEGADESSTIRRLGESPCRCCLLTAVASPSDPRQDDEARAKEHEGAGFRRHEKSPDLPTAEHRRVDVQIGFLILDPRH